MGASKQQSAKKRRREVPSAEVLWADRDKLFEILRTAPSLMVALVLTSYLDASLASLLHQHFADKTASDELMDIGGALESFGARTKAAQALGLIDRAMSADLGKIGKIRNRFAHHHLALDFDDPEIVKLCDSLSLNHDPINVKTGKPMKVPHISGASRVRARFSMMAVYLGDQFLGRVREPSWRPEAEVQSPQLPGSRPGAN